MVHAGTRIPHSAARRLCLVSALLVIALPAVQGQAQILPWPVYPDSSVHALSYCYAGYQGMWREELAQNVNYFHTGLDIPGAQWAPVYAVEPGYVKAVITIFDSENHWRAIIADSSGTQECEGWLYAHLIPWSIAVSVGDHVDTGDSLGIIVTWPYPTTPPHLHFSRVRFAGDSAAWANGFWDYEYPSNPLIHLGPVGDTVFPFLLPALDTQLFAFCVNETDDFFDIGAPLSGAVDIICSAYDRCNYSAYRTAPYRIEYRIAGDSSTPWITAFEFGGSIGSYNGDMAAFSRLVYKYDGPCSTWVGDSLVAFYIMTNSDGDGVLELQDTAGCWNTGRFYNGDHRIVARVSDFDGNSVVDSMTVTVDNSFTLSGTVSLEGISKEWQGTALVVTPDGLNAYTSSAGTYSFPDVGGGYQTVTISRPGYETLDTVVVMDRDRQVDVMLGLAEFTCGNTNGVLPINSSDIIYLLNYVFKSGPAPLPIDCADVNHDGLVTSSDIVYLVNYVFKSGPDPDCG